MIETEAKIKITRVEFENFVDVLGKPEFFIQENDLYEIREGFIRIRREKGNVVVTLKKNCGKSEFNSREEIEFEVKSSVENVRDFLDRAGFKVSLFYKKFRANANVNGCVVSLDSLENGEYYIEIEGRDKGIRKVVEKLGLGNHCLESRSYLEILSRARKE